MNHIALYPFLKFYNRVISKQVDNMSNNEIALSSNYIRQTIHVIDRSCTCSKIQLSAQCIHKILFCTLVLF